MAQSHTINPKASIEVGSAVDEVLVQVGTAVVSYPGTESEPVFLKAGERHSCNGAAPVVVYSPDSANVDVTLSEEVTAAAPAERGDSGGTGGSFESRTVKELRALAKERGITGVSKANKKTLIAKLRGE